MELQIDRFDQVRHLSYASITDAWEFEGGSLKAKAGGPYVPVLFGSSRQHWLDPLFRAHPLQKSLLRIPSDGSLTKKMSTNAIVSLKNPRHSLPVNDDNC